MTLKTCLLMVCKILKYVHNWKSNVILEFDYSLKKSLLETTMYSLSKKLWEFWGISKSKFMPSRCSRSGVKRQEWVVKSTERYNGELGGWWGWWKKGYLSGCPVSTREIGWVSTKGVGLLCKGNNMCEKTRRKA